ncbi:MAG: hypothetical protein ACOCUF_02090 [Patescibacteria group bacterium]
MAKRKIVIIGGGAADSACAFELIKLGKETTAINKKAKKASYAGAERERNRELKLNVSYCV